MRVLLRLLIVLVAYSNEVAGWSVRHAYDVRLILGHEWIYSALCEAFEPWYCIKQTMISVGYVEIFLLH
jgi:hypothetical protein